MRAPNGENIASTISSLQLLADSQTAVERHEQLMDSLSGGSLDSIRPRDTR